MTALIEVRLRCDFPACPAEFRAPGESADSPLGAVRQSAAASGWTRKPFGRRSRLAYDYCPAHPDGRDQADG